MSRKELKTLCEDIWNRMLDLEHIRTWGENDLWVRGNKVKNLLGSVDSFKKIFDQSVDQHNSRLAGVENE